MIIDNRMREDKNKLHWYPEIFQTDDVQDFIDRAFDRQASVVPESFTLTVVNPLTSGSLFGWRIDALKVRGRCGYLV